MDGLFVFVLFSVAFGYRHCNCNGRTDTPRFQPRAGWPLVWEAGVKFFDKLAILDTRTMFKTLRIFDADPAIITARLFRSSHISPHAFIFSDGSRVVRSFGAVVMLSPAEQDRSSPRQPPREHPLQHHRPPVTLNQLKVTFFFIQPGGKNSSPASVLKPPKFQHRWLPC